MATNISSPHVLDPHQRPVSLRGIREETLKAILADIDGQRIGLSFADGSLELNTSVLEPIRWPTFEAILNDVGDHRGVRLAYDCGRLEFMSPSLEHDWQKRSLGRMVEAFTEECEIAVKSGGSVTLRRSDLEKGVEPDESYWIAHESAVRGRMSLDLPTDPPPDLAIEMDVSHSSLRSLPIYAALGVPEVWRFEDGELLIYSLQHDGNYATVPESPGLPGLSAAILERFIRATDRLDETSWIRSFRKWVREDFLPSR